MGTDQIEQRPDAGKPLPPSGRLRSRITRCHGIESCSIEEAKTLDVAGQHGSRRYYQVLLQPNRAKLVEEIAAEKGIRATELIRRMTYDWLERELPASPSTSRRWLRIRRFGRRRCAIVSKVGRKAKKNLKNGLLRLPFC